MKLTINVGGTERLLQSFNEIGLKWKSDSSVETATKINDIIDVYFEKCHGYEFYKENKIMTQFNLEYYSSNIMRKGSITRTVVKKKVDLSKAINRKSEKAHNQTIVKTVSE